MASAKTKSAKEIESKVIGGTVGSAVTGVGIGVGIGLMSLMGGPFGMAVGGILLGGGISSALNTAKQCATDGEFEFRQWGTSVGVGVLGGTIAAPFSAVAGVAAATLSSTTAKVGTVIATEVAGGALSNGVTSSMCKAIEGEKVTMKDFGKSALVGAASSVVGAGLGLGTGKIASATTTKTVKGVTSKSCKAFRFVVSTTGGAVGGFGTGALAKLIENVLEKGKMTKESFVQFMEKCEINRTIAEDLWNLLCTEGIIVNEVVKRELPDSLSFPQHLKKHRKLLKEFIKEFIKASLEYRGILSAATEGAIVGGISGAVANGVHECILHSEVSKLHKQQEKSIQNGGQSSGTASSHKKSIQNSGRESNGTVIANSKVEVKYQYDSRTLTHHDNSTHITHESHKFSKKTTAKSVQLSSAREKYQGLQCEHFASFTT